MEKILIVDDEIDIAELEAEILEAEGYSTIIKNNGNDALNALKEDTFDLILLDIMMPDISGTEICARIRNNTKAPIIFVTAKVQLIDKLIGFEVGADDYITKPFINEEFVARVKAHLRRDKRDAKNSNLNIIEIGSIKVNKDSYEVYKDGKQVLLSTKEFELLAYLMENVGIVLSKEQIYQSVWKNNYGDIGTVAVNIKSLRTKLGLKDEYIKTIWGMGYKFVREE